MRTLFLTLILFLFCVSCKTPGAHPPKHNPPSAQEPSPEPKRENPPLESLDTLVSEVLLLTKLDSRISALASMPVIIEKNVRLSYAREGIDPLPKEVESQLKIISSALRQSFRIDLIRKDVVKALRTRSDDKRLKALVGYFDSKAHRALEDQIAATQTLGGQRALSAFLASLPQRAPDPERMGRARQLVKTSGQVDEHFMLAFEGSKRVINALSKQVAGSLAKSLEASKPRSEFKEKFERDIERALTFQMYFSFQRVADAYVIRELSFYNSALGQWFRKTKSEMVNEVLNQGVARLEKEFTLKPTLTNSDETLH